MTNQEAIEMLTAKVECIRREASGTDIDCNLRNCDECDLCYKQGTMGDQREALCAAISALQAQDSKTRKICKTCKHDPPSKKWPCVDCDMREPADRWESQDVPGTNDGDMVNRRAAIDAVSRGCCELRGVFAECEKNLNDLPSAQPEPCEDAISRRRLLNDLEELTTAWEKYPVMAKQIKGVEVAIGYVELIPSVTPKRKTGKWTTKSTNGEMFDVCSVWIC